MAAGDGDGADIKAVVEVWKTVTSQSRHSLLLQGCPPFGKLLISLERRDGRVVEGARLESVCRGNSTEGSNPSLSAILRYARMASRDGFRVSGPPASPRPTDRIPTLIDSLPTLGRRRETGFPGQWPSGFASAHR